MRKRDGFATGRLHSWSSACADIRVETGAQHGSAGHTDLVALLLCVVLLDERAG